MLGDSVHLFDNFVHSFPRKTFTDASQGVGVVVHLCIFSQGGHTGGTESTGSMSGCDTAHTASTVLYCGYWQVLYSMSRFDTAKAAGATLTLPAACWACTLVELLLDV